MPKIQDGAERALIISSVWLHCGLVGATALAAGLLLLFGDEPNWPWALSLACAGALIAAVSWGRARTILEPPERTAASGTGARSAPTAGVSAGQSGRGATAVHATAIGSDAPR